MRIVSLFVAVLLLTCAIALAQSNAPANNSSAAQENPGQALAHDGHDGLSISADPYTDAERAKKKFGKANPIPAGILPVEVFLRNALNQPIRVDLSTVQLEVRPPDSQRQDIGSLSAVEVAQAIIHPEGSATPTTRRFPPIGLPGGSNDKKVENLAEILRPLSLDADVVPPMGMIHGFLYFDLNHEISLAGSASLYVPDVMIVPSNKPLIFFEVSLSKASDR